jgi:hypothetical protein
MTFAFSWVGIGFSEDMGRRDNFVGVEDSGEIGAHKYVSVGNRGAAVRRRKEKEAKSNKSDASIDERPSHRLRLATWPNLLVCDGDDDDDGDDGDGDGGSTPGQLQQTW